MPALDPATLRPGRSGYHPRCFERGRRRHPAWYHNLRAYPEATILLRGKEGHYPARQAHGAERERLWRRAVDAYAGYEAYGRWTGGREIPAMIFTPQANSAIGTQPARCC